MEQRWNEGAAKARLGNIGRILTGGREDLPPHERDETAKGSAAKAASVSIAPAAAAAQDDDQQNDPQAASAAPAVIAAPHNEYLLIYELRGRLNAALNPILCGGTTKVCHRYFSAKFCSMTATWARVALSSGLRSIRSASELDSRPAPTAQATASPPQLATAAASS